MANALVSMIVNKLREEVYLVGDAKEELINLSSTLESIQALLNDAEIMQFHNESMQVWLKKLKDVVYDVEDVVDEMIPSPESESETHNGDDRLIGNQPWACLFSLFSCCGLQDWIRLAHDSMSDGDDIGDKVRTFVSRVASQRDFAHQIKQVRAKVDQIAADTSKFSFQLNNSFRSGSELHKAESQTSSLVDESQIHGRDEDRDTIISKLISGSSCEEGWIHVISIIGVGGLGKTTLAQLICNDERVKNHFNKVLWVCVSDDFNVINLTKAIIQAAGGTSPPHSQLDSLQKQLMETLQDKLFLLVLDDVWNDDSERWERLWLSLQRGAPGSKILVTTRSEKVAITCMPSAYMHELEGLSDDDCWSLFSSNAFTGRKVVDCLALEKTGREIVNKCKGVPLSVKVIGSVMRSKRTAQDWQDILESETWEIPEIAKGILPALLLSYYNLPVHLKQCFAYCSVFPKDHVMEKDILVKLWLAQGFIKPEGKREMEAIGGEYFDDLLAQSLFRLEYEYEFMEVEEEKVVECTIHDLLHDLAQFITKNEYCIFENGKSDSSSVTARHSSFIVNWETPEIPAALCDAKKLRTLLQIGGSKIDTIPDNLFQCARSLRALDFHIKELPSSIGLLKHLRYLDLSRSDIVELPESVTLLRNLQTLKLNFCRELQRLASGMSAMVCLRHLEIKRTWALKYLPEGLGRISSLRTLSRFIVGGDGGCKIGELKRLNSLQGKLKIEHLERVASVDDAKEAQLENKLQLRVLSLKMSPDDALEMSGNGEVERMENVVEALRPPLANLEQLEIRGYIGYKFPTWIEDYSSFSKLVKLKLKDCNKRTQLPSSIGLLKHLRYLDLSYSDIVELPESVSSLLNLQTLKLNGCEFLQRLPSGMSAMVRLRHLEIKETGKLQYLPEGLGNISSLRTLSRFIVGGDRGCKIGELKRLDSLQGKLKIERLERVASVDEAKEAQLENKLQLRVLSLKMSPDDALEMSESDEVLPDDEVSGDDEVERMDDVLEALRPPHTNLEKLVIKRFIGSKFPTWMEDLRFSNLVDLRLIDCYKCTQLPGLGRLPLLRCLEIKGGLIKRVGHEFYGNSSGGGINAVAFPKLESLWFNDMYELLEWELRLEDGVIMPSLYTLRVDNCPKLKALPTNLPKSLMSLYIWCYEIILWPLPNLPNLKRFQISYLKNMMCLPYRWKQLESLESLTIRDCSKLRSLPDDLGQLKSLRSLDIYYCPELRSLPQGLSGLTDLRIIGCLMLEERCRGEDWSNISHIPNIKIHGLEIKRGMDRR